jgi:tetratricopeptide (TPR) repeat protein
MRRLGQDSFARWEKAPASERSAPGSRVLLVDATPAEVEAYRQKGWQVEAALTLPGLRHHWPEGAIALIGEAGVIAGTGALTGLFQEVIAPYAMAYAANPGALLRALAAPLHPEGCLRIRFACGLHFQELLDRATREMKPWPKHPPKGRLYLPAEIAACAAEADLELAPLQEEVDPMAHHPGAGTCRTVLGLDGRVVLPEDPALRRLSFVKWFDATLRRPEMELPRSLSLAANGDEMLNRVERLLEEAAVDEAEGLLEMLRGRWSSHWKWHCFRGIVHFYRKQYQAAYLKFLDALEIAPAEADLYRNLVDCAESLGRVEDVRQLLEHQVGVHSELASVWAELAPRLQGRG